MNKQQLFFDFTSAICRHLQPKDSLFAAFNVLRQHLSVDHAFLEAFDFDLGVVHALAEARVDGGKQLNRQVPIGPELKSIMNARKSSLEKPAVVIMNEPAKNSIARQMLGSFGGSLDCSLIVLNPVLDGAVVGAIVLINESGKPFTQEDADLLALLDRPCAISIINSLKHQQLLLFQSSLEEENQALHIELRAHLSNTIVGADFGLAPTLSLSNKASQHDSPVLLLGETGVGKDVLANYIHRVSARNQGPFISVNCGAIPDALMDSELFGHEKGAFTGAVAMKRGKFERANGGTIFLDEIGELPMAAQVRLLRVLQNRELERVGGATTITLDLRVIAATHRDIEKMVRDGEFREDLYFRLNVFPIEVPPLRDRKQDIPALVDFFIKRKTQHLKLGKPPTITPELVQTLCEYHWPGNVRELENVIERALITSEQGQLSVPFLDSSHRVKGEACSTEPDNTSIEPLDIAIAKHIKRALNATNGQVHGEGGAAQLLEINPNTLRSRMRKLKIPFS